MKFVKLGNIPTPRGATALNIEAGKVVAENGDKVKVAVPEKQGGTTIIHIIEVALDAVGDLIAKGDDLWQKLEALFRVLPDGIMIEDKLYRYTRQDNTKSKENALEAVIMYQHNVNGSTHEAIVTRKGKTLKEAKDNAYKALVENGYL